MKDIIDHAEVINPRKNSKKSHNYFLFGLGCYACVAFVGYFFLRGTENIFLTVLVLLLCLIGYILLILSIVFGVRGLVLKEGQNFLLITTLLSSLILVAILSLVLFANMLDLIRLYKY